MLKTINLYNEKGNVSAKVRNALKLEVLPQLSDALSGLGDVITGTDNALYIAVAQTEQGETIYARVEMTISVKNPSAE
jgi:hypothetical protein